MKTRTILVLLALLTGCTGSFTGRAPETQVCPLLAVPPERAYQLSWLAMTRIGTHVTAWDKPSQLSGVVRHAADLHVSLVAHHPGTVVQATASIPPGKLIVGTFTVLDEFCATLTALETADAH